MRRYIPLLILVLVGVGVAVWHVWRVRTQPSTPPPAPTLVQPAQPLEPPSPSVQAGQAFLEAWANERPQEAYDLLAPKMRALMTQVEFTAMIREIPLSAPQHVAHVDTAQAAYVIFRVQAPPPAQGEKPLAGYSLLLTQEQGKWRVAFMTAEEKVSEKYEDLRLSPGAKGGWTVTYQNEQGQVNTVALPAL